MRVVSFPNQHSINVTPPFRTLFTLASTRSPLRCANHVRFFIFRSLPMKNDTTHITLCILSNGDHFHNSLRKFIIFVTSFGVWSFGARPVADKYGIFSSPSTSLDSPHRICTADCVDVRMEVEETRRRHCEQIDFDSYNLFFISI